MGVGWGWGSGGVKPWYSYAFQKVKGDLEALCNPGQQQGQQFSQGGPDGQELQICGCTNVFKQSK